MEQKILELRKSILAQKQACLHAPPTAVEWSEGYEAALGWVLFRLDGLLIESDNEKEI